MPEQRFYSDRLAGYARGSGSGRLRRATDPRGIQVVPRADKADRFSIVGADGDVVTFKARNTRAHARARARTHTETYTYTHALARAHTHSVALAPSPGVGRRTAGRRAPNSACQSNGRGLSYSAGG